MIIVSNILSRSREHQGWPLKKLEDVAFKDFEREIGYVESSEPEPKKKKKKEKKSKPLWLV